MAARFWVGGTGAWDNADTSHWSATTGGAGGASVPTSADDVTFDANSGTAATVTIQTATANANTITINKSDLTLTHSGFGSTVVGVVTLTTGTLNTNGQTCSWGYFSTAGTASCSLQLGSSSITCTTNDPSTGVAFASINTAWTFNAGTSTVTFQGQNANLSCTGKTFNNVVITIPGAGTAVINIGSCLNLTVTGAAVKGGGLKFSSITTITCTGTCTLGGGSTQGVNRLLVQSNTVGTQRTITAAAYVITGDVDFMDINLAYSGGASWTNTGNAYIGDALGNAGAVTTNATTPAIQTATGTASFTWSTHGWTSRVPLPQDDVVINNAFVAGRAITADMPRMGANINLSGCTGSPNLALTVGSTLFGSLTMVAGMTTGSGGTIIFAGRSACTLTSAGVTLTGPVTLNAPSGSLTLQDALSLASGRTLTASIGTLTTGGFAIQSDSLSIASAATVNWGTTAYTLTATSGTSWSVSSSAVCTGTPSVTFSAAATNIRTFGGGGQTYGTLTYIVANSPGALVITGANTFNTLNVGSGRVLTMPSATTNTITNFNVNGATNGYVRLPGVAGHYASAPDSVPLSITGDIDIRCKVALDDWTPAVNSAVVAKETASNRSFGFFVISSGALALEWSPDGTNALFTSSTVATGVADGSVKWVRVTLDVDDGGGNRVSKFYTSDDGSSWTQLGTTVTTAGTTSIFDTNQVLAVGSMSDGGYFSRGKFYRAQIRNNILDNGTGIVFDADFTTKAVGANTFIEGSANAATVTINGNLAQAGDGRIIAASSTPGTKWTVNTAVASASYVDVQDSTASGNGSPINNPTGVNRGNNGGWNFNATGGSFFPFM